MNILVATDGTLDVDKTADTVVRLYRHREPRPRPIRRHAGIDRYQAGTSCLCLRSRAA